MWKFIVDNFFHYWNAIDRDIFQEKLQRALDRLCTEDDFLSNWRKLMKVVNDFAYLEDNPFLGSSSWYLVLSAAMVGLAIYLEWTNPNKQKKDMESGEMVPSPLEISSIDFLSFKSDLIITFLDVVSCQEILLSIA